MPHLYNGFAFARQCSPNATIHTIENETASSTIHQQHKKLSIHKIQMYLFCSVYRVPCHIGCEQTPNENREMRSIQECCHVISCFNKKNGIGNTILIGNINKFLKWSTML